MDDDPTGLQRAVYDYNEWKGPARIFYSIETRTFSTRTYEPESDCWWDPSLYRGPESAELQRKTTAHSNDRVEDYELRLMADNLGPFIRW